MGYGEDRIWRQHYRLGTYQLDAALRLSPQGACDLLIDTAAHNADALGASVPQLLEQERTWFLSRLLLRLREHPGWREPIEVQTWPCGFRRLFALRQWRLLCRGRQVGEAASAWLMVDNRTRRPVRPQTLAAWGRFIREEQALEHEFAPLPAIDATGGDEAAAGLEERAFHVRFADVDINGHAGYLSYVNWALETVPPEVRSSCRLAELEVHYLAEVSRGERVRALARVWAPRPGERPGAGVEYLHSLVRDGEGREVCRARSLWVSPPARDLA